MNTKANSICLSFCVTKFAFALLLMWLLTDKEGNAQNFWQQTNGPDEAEVYALVINSSGHIFAGTSGSGVFRSTNNGDNWAAVNSGLTNTYVSALAINSSGHIFAGIYRDGIFGSDGGVFRSTNNGNSWTAVYSGLPNTGVYALAINTSGHIFVGTVRRGIFRSLNNGDSWTAVGLPNTIVSGLAINSSGHIFAGTSSGVFRSTNNGNSWTAVNSGLPNTVSDLAINSSGHIFAVVFSGPQGGGGIFRSTNNGDSWTPSLPNRYFDALAINSSGHIFAGGDEVVFLSTNNGDSWTNVGSGLPKYDTVPALAINSSGYIFAGTIGGVVYRSVQSTTAVKTDIEFRSTFELTQNYPNPFNPSTTIEYALPKPEQVELKVYDILGHDVRTLVSGRQPAGKYRVLFEAKDLPAGLYFYRIKAGEFLQTKKFMLLK
jgi:ligand-binding sensor domain-containing protein